jgi:tripartite-type tricarboxylate transporter receptor subunit TctC
VLAAAGAASAQTPEQFYRGKSVDLVIGYPTGGSNDPELPDIPTAVDLARSDEERKVVTAIIAAAEIGTAFFTTPRVPADRVLALRRAFDETMKDPEFLDEAMRSNLTVGPMTGEELQKLVVDVSSLPPDLLTKVRTAYGVHY